VGYVIATLKYNWQYFVNSWLDYTFTRILCHTRFRCHK